MSSAYRASLRIPPHPGPDLDPRRLRPLDRPRHRPGERERPVAWEDVTRGRLLGGHPRPRLDSGSGRGQSEGRSRPLFTPSNLGRDKTMMVRGFLDLYRGKLTARLALPLIDRLRDELAQSFPPRRRTAGKARGGRPYKTTRDEARLGRRDREPLGKPHTSSPPSRNTNAGPWFVSVGPRYLAPCAPKTCPGATTWTSHRRFGPPTI